MPQASPILVTGATGNIGRALVKQLSAAGATVKALVRDPGKAAALQAPGVTIVQGDLADPASLDAALDGVDHVFLLSAMVPGQVELQGNLVEAARRAGRPHIVKLSVYGAGPDAPVPFARWHWQTEQQIEQAGLPFTHLRPNNFMQNLLGQGRSIAGQGAFYDSIGADTPVSQVDVRDIAAVAASALTQPGHAGKTYQVMGPEAISNNDMAATLSEVLGKPVRYVQVPAEDYKRSLMGYGVPEWLADTLNALNAYYDSGYGAELTDTVRAVGQKEPTTFGQFAADFAPTFTTPA